MFLLFRESAAEIAAPFVHHLQAVFAHGQCVQRNGHQRGGGFRVDLIPHHAAGFPADDGDVQVTVGLVVLDVEDGGLDVGGDRGIEEVFFILLFSQLSPLHSIPSLVSFTSEE